MLSKRDLSFYPEGAAERTYYISNHDQDNPKKVGLALEDMKSLTIEGNGAEFIFHGQMIPVSLLRSTDCTLQNFSIDFANPHIAQVEIIKNEGEKGITFQPAPWVDYHLTKDSIFETKGDGWELRPMSGIALRKPADTSYTIPATSLPGQKLFSGRKEFDICPQMERQTITGRDYCCHAFMGPSDSWHFLVTQHPNHNKECQGTLCTRHGIAGSTM